MSTRPIQELANHKRYVPGFHFLTGGLTLLNLGWALVGLVRAPSAVAAGALLSAVVLAHLFWYVRVFPLVVQDRLICLEERLRMREILPAELKARIAEFTADQLIALRFASDGELPSLAARVLEQHLTDRRAIKLLIAAWRPDLRRA